MSWHSELYQQNLLEDVSDSWEEDDEMDRLSDEFKEDQKLFIANEFQNMDKSFDNSPIKI